MDAQLKGKVVLITGASGGIGAAMARKFAGEGASLALHYRSGAAAVEELHSELGGIDTLPVQADLTVEGEVVRMMEQVRERFGRIDTLVANAGIWIEDNVPLASMSLAQWNHTIETDLTSVFLCCREFLKLVAAQRAGNVVLISSTAGVFGEAGHADYSSAKSALAYGLTRTLKNEIVRLAPHTRDYCGGRVNCICPGWTITPMAEEHLRDAALVSRVTATMALPQIARADDVANAAVFLASDALARHITGQTLVIAGGMEGRLLWNAGEVDLTAV